MTNLFSTFDPSSSVANTSINWTSTLIGLMIIPSMYWLMPSRNSIMWTMIMENMHNEFKMLIGYNKINKGITLLMVSLLSLVLYNNLMGLFPYIFTSTSHLAMTLSLALPMWLSFMIFGWINNMQYMFAHLTPQGTPPILMPFMVCIETISNLIRPGTLAVRLTANMIAGHLLMTLLSSMGPISNYYILMLLLLIQLALLTLELAVAVIQSYVFTVLMTLYSSEIN
uniref:ATP synthase subunit a n=1 Tax=Lamproblatta sp. LA male TaxID=2093468 RepID=A0A2P1H9H9_9NEOP|nr:ATP synthase F0 subunit 6 [Lamproblatta sp. LA male]